MVQQLSYSTIAPVIDSWEQLKRTKGFQEKAGIILFRRLFDQCPEAKVLFGFPIDIDTNSSELLQSKRFRLHAAYLMEMLDSALNMLGPDIELLTEILRELGAKHRRYGVKEHWFPIMGRALLEALEQTLGDKAFTEETKSAWVATYAALSRDMIEAMKV